MASHSLPDIVELAFALIASGVLAGLLVGLFGAYGGLVIVPVLHPVFVTLGMQGSVVFWLAAGASLALVAVTAAQSWRSKHGLPADSVQSDGRMHGADWRWSVAAGAVASSVVVAAMPGLEVQVIFTCAMLAGAVKMLFLSRPLVLAVPSRLLSDNVVSEAVMQPAGLSPVGALGLGGAPLAAHGGGAGGPPTSLSGLLRQMGGEGLAPFALQMAAQFAVAGARLCGMAGRVTASPVAVCGLLAIPAVAGLGLILFGDAQLPLGLSNDRSAIGVGVILLSAMLLAPVGAELSGQFSKRMLEVSLGLFLLLAAGQFAYNLLQF